MTDKPSAREIIGRVGTLEYILASVAHHLGLDRQELTQQLF